MAVTDFISRLKAKSTGPSDSDLGMGMGVGGSQMPFSDPPASTSGSLYLESDESALSYLKSIYGPLKRHYDWFRRTQRGQIKQYSRKSRSRTEAYRWRGRSQMHVLTSGMDDFPRGPPHAGELHLDLISWMGFFTRTMRDIADFVGETEDAANAMTSIVQFPLMFLSGTFFPIDAMPDALKTVAHGVNSLRGPDLGILLITHYQRLLNYIIPDYVHVMVAGRIVRSGRKELALELEERGYDWAREGAAEPAFTR